MKKQIHTLALISLSFSAANAAVLTLTDEILVAGNGVVPPFGVSSNPNTGGPNGGAGPQAWRYVARERNNEGQNDRRVATFLQYDTSSLTVADVNDPNFQATFEIDHVGNLNTINPGLDLVLGQVSGAWDDSGTMNPVYNWAEVSSNQTLLLENLQNHTGTVPISVDITPIVQDWVLNGTNQGIALFGDQFGAPGGNLSNASYLENASLSWEIIPEPSTGILGLLGAGLLVARRRR